MPCPCVYDSNGRHGIFSALIMQLQLVVKRAALGVLEIVVSL